MNITGKIWTIKDDSELRFDYPYGILHVGDNCYQYVNREYADLYEGRKRALEGRSGWCTFTLNAEQLDALGKICSVEGDCLFLYDARNTPWSNEQNFDKYFNKLASVRFITGRRS